MKYTSSAILISLLQPTTSFTLNVPSFTNRHAATYPKTFTSLPYAATEELTPGIDAINSLNEDLVPMLNTLRDQPYFRLYSVDMLGSCEYMPQELFECYAETCEIYPVDEDEVRATVRLPMYM